MGAPTTNRRSLCVAIGAAALAPAAVFAIPAPVSAVPMLMAANKAAEARFDALPEAMELSDPAAYEAETDRMIAAYRAALNAEPATWGEYVEQFALVTGDGRCGIDEDWAGPFLARARRLAGVRH